MGRPCGPRKRAFFQMILRQETDAVLTKRLRRSIEQIRKEDCDMKRTISMILAILMIAAAFAGCGSEAAAPSGSGAPTESSSAGGSAPAAEGEAVTFKFMHQWAEENRLPYWENLVNSYMEANPNVTIETEVVPNEPYKEKIRVMLGGNDVPDLFFTWDGEWVSRFAKNKAITELDSLMSDEFKASFNQGILTTGQVDGVQYSLPIRTCVNFVLYNKQIFADNNITIPTTWDEFMAVCETLKNAGVTPIALGNAEGWAAAHYVSALNVQMVPWQTLNDDYYLVTGDFTDPGYLDAMNLLKAMNDKGYFMDGMTSTSQNIAREMFNAGQTAMIYDQCASFKTYYLDKMEADSWDVFALPVVEGAKGDLDMMVAWVDQFAVSSTSQCPDAVIDFLEYFYNEENQLQMQKELGFVSTISSVTGNTENSFPQLVAAMEIIDKCKGFISVIDLEMDGSVASVYQSGIQELFTTKTAEQIMEEVRAEAARVKAEQ